MDCVEAFVLHARAYRESSQLVELLTAEQGRIGVLARGSRGAKRAQPLQPFRRYRIMLGGRGELRRAQSVEAVGVPRLLAGHKLYAALYLNELLVRLLYREVPMPGVFELYDHALDALVGGESIEIALRCFEKQLIDELGYGHRYLETVTGEPVEAGRRYTFEAHVGVRLAAPGLNAAQCFRGSALKALANGVFCNDADNDGGSAADLRDAKRLMRLALAPHLGDKPLNSRELFRRARVDARFDGIAGAERNTD